MRVTMVILVTWLVLTGCVATRQATQIPAGAVLHSRPLSQQELEEKEYWENLNKQVQKRNAEEQLRLEAEEAQQQAEEAKKPVETAFETRDRTQDIDKPMSEKDRKLQQKINKTLQFLLWLPIPIIP